MVSFGSIVVASSFKVDLSICSKFQKLQKTEKKSEIFEGGRKWRESQETEEKASEKSFENCNFGLLLLLEPRCAHKTSRLLPLKWEFSIRLKK